MPIALKRLPDARRDIAQAMRYPPRMVQFFAPLLQPLGMLWVLLLLLTGYRLWRRQRLRAVLPGALALAISVFGNMWVGAQLIATLERPYVGVNWAALATADAVVMLGGTMDISTNDVFRFEFKDTADRPITALELIRRGKGRALVLGGGGPSPEAENPARSEGQLLQGWMAAWGFTNAPVFLLGSCKNTRDEALRTQALFQARQWRSLILVSSASHMKRAEATFRRLGLPVTCVACDFQGVARLEGEMPFNPFPSGTSFGYLSAYLHERIGWQVYRWRGWVGGG